MLEKVFSLYLCVPTQVGLIEHETELGSSLSLSKSVFSQKILSAQRRVKQRDDLKFENCGKW